MTAAMHILRDDRVVVEVGRYPVGLIHSLPILLEPMQPNTAIQLTVKRFGAIPAFASLEYMPWRRFYLAGARYVQETHFLEIQAFPHRKTLHAHKCS